MSDRIRGGLAASRSPRSFPSAALRKGTAVELEHVCRPGKKPTAKDRAIAREIAMDHLVESPTYYDRLEKMERKMSARVNPPKHKIPLLRRRQALALATQVATTGWTHHEPKNDRDVEYWSKRVPSGTLEITESYSAFGSGYRLQHIAEGGHITNLGRSTGTIADAKVKAVLGASTKGFAVVNPRASSGAGYRTVPAAKLRTGMIVRAPRHVVDERGRNVPLAKVWGKRPPDEFRVAAWNWHDGTSRLVAVGGSGSLDLNTGDYPTMFEVRIDPIPSSMPARKNGDGARALPNRSKPKAGFVDLPMAEQQRVLRECVRKHGYRSCLGSVMFVHNASRDAATKARMRQLQQWMHGAFNNKCTCRKNPDDGSWDAVPIIIGQLHIHMPRMRLTSQQLSVLQMETT